LIPLNAPSTRRDVRLFFPVIARPFEAVHAAVVTQGEVADVGRLAEIGLAAEPAWARSSLFSTATPVD